MVNSFHSSSTCAFWGCSPIRARTQETASYVLAFEVATIDASAVVFAEMKGMMEMADNQSSEERLASLLGESLLSVWASLRDRIEGQYEMGRTWNDGGKAWDLEYKYRCGGKTLCALYAKEGYFGFMVILGKDERAKFEADRDGFSKAVQQAYDDARTYHDGKWIMFEPTDDSHFDDYMRLLAIKRRPNRKR